MHQRAIATLARRDPRIHAAIAGCAQPRRRHRTIRDSLIDNLFAKYGVARIVPDLFLWDAHGLTCIEVTVTHRVTREKLIVYSNLASLLDLVEMSFTLWEVSGSGRIMNRWDTADLMGWTIRETDYPIPLSPREKLELEYFGDLSPNNALDEHWFAVDTEAA